MDQQPDLFDLRTPEGKAAAYRAVLARLARCAHWATCRQLRADLPWLTPQRMSRLLEIDDGSISSTASGYLLTARLDTRQNEEADKYLRSRIRKQTSRMVRRSRKWHAATT